MVEADTFFAEWLLKTCIGPVLSKLIGCVILGGLILGAKAAPADELDLINEIRWLKIDIPPIGIASGPLAGKGMHGGIITTLLGQPPRDENVAVHANIARLYLQVRSENYCIPGLMRNAEREKVLYFSELPSARLASSHLIYARSNQRLRPYLVEDVSLETLLKNGFVVGVGAKVSYGERIDALIAKYAATNSVVSHPAPNFIAPMVSMVAQNRVDFFLAPPWLMTWRFVAQGIDFRAKDTPEIATHPFREASEMMNYHAACSRSRWGKEMIALLNKRLARPDVQEALAHNADVWMSIEAAETKFSE